MYNLYNYTLIQLLITLSVFLLKFFVPFNRRPTHIPNIFCLYRILPALSIFTPLTTSTTRSPCPYLPQQKHIAIRNRNNKREKYVYLCNQRLEIRILAQTKEELNGEKQTKGWRHPRATTTETRGGGRGKSGRGNSALIRKTRIRRQSRQEIPARKCSSTVRFFNLHLLGWLNDRRRDHCCPRNRHGAVT